MDPLFAAIWVGWIFAVSGSFAFFEKRAIDKHRAGFTLSAFTRWVFKTRTRKGRWAWFVVAGGGGGIFLAWFVTHIAVAGSA